MEQTKKPRISKAQILVIVTPLFWLNVSCGLYGSNQNSAAVVKTCNIPADQSGTISGHWSTVPVPVAFHQGAFDATETAKITAAAESWNQFFTVSQAHTAINYGSASNPTVTAVTNPSFGGSLSCAGQGIVSVSQPGSAFTGNVVVYKVARWPAAYKATAMAITSFCYLSASGTTTGTKGVYPYFYMAVIELNYQGFFVQGMKQPDLQSILLHEFGHLMGLNHSCDVGQAGFPNCNDSNLNPEYIAASMYPVFGFDDSGMGQQKRSLGKNDQSRANCLYDSKSGGTTTGTTTNVTN